MDGKIFSVEFCDTTKKRRKWERCMTFSDKGKAEQYAEHSRQSQRTGGRFEFRVRPFKE